MVTFGDPSKTKGAPKTSQKIQYGDFLAPRGGQKAPKSRFWRGLKSALIFRSFLDGFPEEKAPKMMPKWRSKSLNFRCDFGACDFLFFAKSLTLKSFFYIIREAKNDQKSIKNRCKNDVRKNDARRSRKRAKREPKMIKNPGILC